MPTLSFYGDPPIDTTLLMTNGTFNQQILNASGTGVGSVTFADDITTHGAIVGLGYNCSAIVGSPTLVASIQSLTSSYVPSGTVLGSTSTTFAPSTGFNTVTFANAYTPTINDMIALCVQYSSGSTSATLNYKMSIAGGTRIFPAGISQASSTWTIGGGAGPLVCPIYADGFIGRGFIPAKTAFNNVTASTAYGTLWTAPCQSIFDAAIVAVRPAASSNLQVSLYEGSSTTAASDTIVSQSQVMSFASALSSIDTFVVPMPKYTLKANTVYRLVVANSGTAYTTLGSVSCTTQSYLQSFWGNLAGTILASGTFTDYASGSDWRAFPIVPMIDSYTVSSGGGTMMLSGGSMA